MRAISLKLSESLDRQLTQLARQRRVSRSALVREAVQLYAAQPGKSVAAAAADLAGLLKGPTDLSSSSKHLDGYGR